MDDKDYAAKRAFDATPEPTPEVTGNVDPFSAPPGRTFVIHQHHARRLHFDLRLEMMNGEIPVLASWAVPKNLPEKKGKPHLAVHVEDHPLEYGSFSGTIPQGNYGAGEVRIFDSGTYEVLEREPSKLTFRLVGNRMRGVYHLIDPHTKDRPNDHLVFLRTQERDEPEPLPSLAPMLATLEREAFDDDRWLAEFKWDGVRALAVCSDETALLSRNGRDITATYPELASLHSQIVAVGAVIDGEIVAMSDGRPSFEYLQGRINLQNPRDIERAMKTVPVTYIAFDVLYLDGRSTVQMPLETRKALLGDIVVPGPRIQVSPVERGAGAALFAIARERNLEGIVLKKIGSPYRPGRRGREWIKVKATFDADVVIGGWSRGEGSRSKTFGALLAGVYEDDALKFLGAVGTGFSEKMLDELMPLFQGLESSDCPFEGGEEAVRAGRFGKPIHEPRWMRPELVARVEYRELTHGSRLRAPSFKGLRTDLDARDCRLEDLPGRA